MFYVVCLEFRPISLKSSIVVCYVYNIVKLTYLVTYVLTVR